MPRTRERNARSRVRTPPPPTMNRSRSSTPPHQLGRRRSPVRQRSSSNTGKSQRTSSSHRPSPSHRSSPPHRSSPSYRPSPYRKRSPSFRRSSPPIKRERRSPGPGPSTSRGSNPYRDLGKVVVKNENAVAGSSSDRPTHRENDKFKGFENIRFQILRPDLQVDKVVIPRREDEGKKPIFDREEIKNSAVQHDELDDSANVINDCRKFIPRSPQRDRDRDRSRERRKRSERSSSARATRSLERSSRERRESGRNTRSPVRRRARTPEGRISPRREEERRPPPEEYEREPFPQNGPPFIRHQPPMRGRIIRIPVTHYIPVPVPGPGPRHFPPRGIRGFPGPRHMAPRFRPPGFAPLRPGFLP